MIEGPTDSSQVKHFPSTVGLTYRLVYSGRPIRYYTIETWNTIPVAYRCPNPDNTFSRFFTASINAGTFSGLHMLVRLFGSFCLIYTYFPIEMSMRMTASLAPPVWKSAQRQ